jgi:hypothetical protein
MEAVVGGLWCIENQAVAERVTGGISIFNPRPGVIQFSFPYVLDSVHPPGIDVLALGRCRIPERMEHKQDKGVWVNEKNS